MSEPLFSVLRTDETPMAIANVAASIVPAGAGVMSDVTLKLQRYPGWMARKVPASVAASVVKACLQNQIAAEIVPELKVVEPPEVLTVARMELQPLGFFVMVKKQPMFIKWSELIAIDAYEAGIESQKKETVQKLDFPVRGLIPSMKTETQITQQVEWRLRAELCCFDPWLTLRIEADTFPFASTGLTVSSSRQLSLATLLKAIQERAPDASVCHAVAQAQPGKVMNLPRLMTTFPNTPNLSWRLTRLFIEGAKGNGPLAGKVPA